MKQTITLRGIDQSWARDYKWQPISNYSGSPFCTITLGLPTLETFKLYSATQCVSDACLIIRLAWLCKMKSPSNQKLVANTKYASGLSIWTQTPPHHGPFLPYPFERKHLHTTAPSSPISVQLVDNRRVLTTNLISS